MSRSGARWRSVDDVRGRGGQCSKLSSKSSAPVPSSVSATPSRTGLRRLAHADDMGDRGRDELGIGHRGEADEVNRPLDRAQRGHLERKPALAGAAGPGDRDEPHVRTREQRLGREVGPGAGRRGGDGERAASSRRACASGANPSCSPAATSWKSCSEPGTSFSRWLPERAERELRDRRRRRRRGSPRDDDLTAVGGGADPAGATYTSIPT